MKPLIFLLAVCLVAGNVFAQKEKNQLILHKVAPKETLYSLVKKYNTNFATVENLNPSLADGNSDLKVGQIVKFPNNAPVIAAANTKSKATKTKIHEVQAKETIFSISKKYNVDISNLVEANNITSNTIKVGQKLIVDETDIAKIAATSKRDTELRLKPAGKNVRETGVAEVINTDNKSKKYLALHRNAPVGSNIKITNEATGHSIVARVIGNLNEKGRDEKIMIKLSPYAYYQLRPKDARLRATVEYYMPNANDELVSK